MWEVGVVVVEVVVEEVAAATVSDEAARARRVQQQVQMRLAEKSTLPRQNGGAGGYSSSGKPEQTPRCE